MEPAAEQVGQEAAAILSEGKGPRDSRQLSTPRAFTVAEGRSQPTVAPLRPSILRSFTSTFHSNVLPFPVLRLVSAPKTSKRR